jgi:hypothetical protein
MRKELHKMVWPPEYPLMPVKFFDHKTVPLEKLFKHHQIVPGYMTFVYVKFPPVRRANKIANRPCVGTGEDQFFRQLPNALLLSPGTIRDLKDVL